MGSALKKYNSCQTALSVYLSLHSCQSPAMSDTVLVDIPHIDNLTFNNKFAYLKTCDVS